MSETAHQTPIQRFYAGKSVFITGGTGFLGTILIEKLLRSCPDISTLYVLVRSKRGKNVQTRMNDLFEISVFDRLKKERPKFRRKVVGVVGDCSLPSLGISLQDRQMLRNEVSIVFHVAATVHLDENLKIATVTNIRGTQEVIKLAREMPHLQSLIHVSTAYSHVPNSIIEEKFYPCPMASRKLILLTEVIPENNLGSITPIILGKWPNTYTYTKAIAEDVVHQEGQDMPIAVFRPSIVVSTYLEPTEAWINNLYGPTGVCACAGNGILRAVHCNSEANANVIPADMCVNSIIATSWDVANNYKSAKKTFDIPVYHYESSNDNPLTWGRFLYLAYTYGRETPSIKAIWCNSFGLYDSIFKYNLAIIILHYLPATLIDGALLCMGKRPKMLRIYQKIHKFTSFISYFSTRHWTFKSKNVNEVIRKMTKDDNKLFFCDLKKLDWNLFFRNYFKGIRLYLLQDSMYTEEQAKTRWKRLYYFHFLMKAISAYLIIRLLSWILRIL